MDNEYIVLSILAGLLKLRLQAGTKFMWRGVTIVVLDEEYVGISGRWGVFLCEVDSFGEWWRKFIKDMFSER
jgi:hypothetical protein